MQRQSAVFPEIPRARPPLRRSWPSSQGIGEQGRSRTALSPGPPGGGCKPPLKRTFFPRFVCSPLGGLPVPPWPRGSSPAARPFAPATARPRPGPPRSRSRRCRRSDAAASRARRSGPVLRSWSRAGGGPRPGQGTPGYGGASRGVRAGGGGTWEGRRPTPAMRRATDTRTSDRRRAIYRLSRRVSIDLCRPCLAFTWPKVAAHEHAGAPPRTGRVGRRRRNGEDPPLLLPDASASVNASAGFFKRGDCRFWGDGRREGPRAGVCPVRNDPDDPILPEATAPSDRHGIAAARTGPGPTRSGEGV